MMVKRLSAQLIPALVSFVVTLVVFEAVLRVAGYTYVPMKIEISNNSEADWRFHHMLEDQLHEYDSYLIWKPRASHAVFNAQGYRGKLLEAEKPPGAIRIFAVGDSNTLGWFDMAHNWPEYLEQMFGRPDVTVTNAGAWGYSSFQGLRRFEQALPYEPDLVLVSFGANDAHRVTMSDAEFAGRRAFDAAMSRLRLGQLVIAFLDKSLMKNRAATTPRVSLEEYADNLREIIETSREHGIRVVLLTRPFIGDSPYELWWKNFAPQYNAVTRSIGAESDVPVIDVHAAFENRGELFHDESHFNEQGHREMARLLYEAGLERLVGEMQAGR